MDSGRIYDVLVAGGGNAALCAALSVRRAGAGVLVLEAAPRHFRGGNSRHTRNFRSMHSSPADTLTESYPEMEYWNNLVSVTGGQTNERLARMVIRQSDPCRRWMMDHGVRFQPSLGGPLLFASNPDLVWELIASLYIGNFMLLVLNLPLAPLWARLLEIPQPLLYGGILVFATLGTYSLNNSVFDVGLMYLVGLAGFSMRRLRIPAQCMT